MLRRPCWALLISGRGSNMAAVTDCVCRDFDIRLVVSNRSSAAGLVRAKRWGIPTETLENPTDWPQLHQRLISLGINRIFLLGFMKILPAQFVELWRGKIFNLHPSLLPAYKGLRAIEASYNDGSAMGVTVHQVVPEMDAGQILLQQQTLPKAIASRHSLTFEQAQLLISREEQRLVRDAFERLSS